MSAVAGKSGATEQQWLGSVWNPVVALRAEIVWISMPKQAALCVAQ